MSLYPPHYFVSTLTSLDAAGIAIVQKDNGWFVKSYRHMAGPYATPEAALDASMSWLSENGTRDVSENTATDHNDLFTE
jgi:hypothetical protein